MKSKTIESPSQQVIVDVAHILPCPILSSSVSQAKSVNFLHVLQGSMCQQATHMKMPAVPEGKDLRLQGEGSQPHHSCPRGRKRLRRHPDGRYVVDGALVGKQGSTAILAS